MHRTMMDFPLTLGARLSRADAVRRRGKCVVPADKTLHRSHIAIFTAAPGAGRRAEPA